MEYRATCRGARRVMGKCLQTELPCRAHVDEYFMCISMTETKRKKYCFSQRCE